MVFLSTLSSSTMNSVKDDVLLHSDLAARNDVLVSLELVDFLLL